MAEEEEQQRLYLEQLEATRRAAAQRLMAEDSAYVEWLGQQALRSLEQDATARRQAGAQAAAARRAEEAARRAREAEQVRASELREQSLRLAVEAQRQREEAEHQLEEERRAALRAQVEREREQEAVASFLRAEGFDGVCSGRRRTDADHQLPPAQSGGAWRRRPRGNAARGDGRKLETTPPRTDAQLRRPAGREGRPRKEQGRLPRPGAAGAGRRRGRSRGRGRRRCPEGRRRRPRVQVGGGGRAAAPERHRAGRAAQGAAPGVGQAAGGARAVPAEPPRAGRRPVGAARGRAAPELRGRSTRAPHSGVAR
ncbi:unnamed protein product, partial [Prorocentrum cordatum]